MKSSLLQKVTPRFVHDLAFARSAKRHLASGTNHCWQKKYTDYYDYCRSVYDGPSVSDEIRPAIECYHKNGFFSFANDQTERLAEAASKRLAGYLDDSRWGDMDSELTVEKYLSDIYFDFPECAEMLHGVTGDVIRGCMGCHFKIFFGMMFRSRHWTNTPNGSQLWHSDGAPGPVMKFFFHLTPVNEKNGGTEILPWNDSVKIYTQTRGLVAEAETMFASEPQREKLRARQVEIWSEAISRDYRDKTVQLSHPRPGLIAGFRTNTLHRGGYVPTPGEERIVWMLSIYPSDKPTPFEHYAANGIRKTSPILHDPAA